MPLACAISKQVSPETTRCHFLHLHIALGCVGEGADVQLVVVVVAEVGVPGMPNMAAFSYGSLNSLYVSNLPTNTIIVAQEKL
jgi:hypothetical protein